MTEILKGSSFSNHLNPNKLIFLLHGYGDNANNFINIAKALDLNEWGAYYIALNAPNHVPNYPIGYEWFNLYPNGIYINDAGAKEKEIVKEQVKTSILKIEKTIKFYTNKLNLLLGDCIVIGFSQGGMMTFELGNHLTDQLRALQKKSEVKEILRQLDKLPEGQLKVPKRKPAPIRSNDTMGVAEIYSPPRITETAAEMNLKDGWALDLTVQDEEDGMPWDFSIEQKKTKAKNKNR